MAKPPPPLPPRPPNPPRRPAAYGVAPPAAGPKRRATGTARAAAAAVRRRMGRYPVWSARAVLALFVAGIAVTAPLVLWLGHRRLLVDMEILLAVVAAAMFLFLSVGLFRGVRVKKQEAIAGELKLVGSPGVGGGGGNWGPNWGSGCLDLGGDGCGEALGGIVLGIVMLVVLVVAIWLFINVALIAFFLLSVALGWVFQRALRQVFAKSRVCRGNAAASLLYAAWYTFLYTGWLFAVLMLADRLSRAKGA